MALLSEFMSFLIFIVDSIFITTHINPFIDYKDNIVLIKQFNAFILV